MKSSVAKRESDVREKVAGIRKAVLVCVELARSGEVDREGEIAGLKGHLMLAGVEGDEKTEKKVSEQQSTRSTTGATTSSRGGGGEVERWRVTGDIGEEGEAILSYVCGLVFDSVTEMMGRSHCQLSCGLRRGESERDPLPPTVPAKLSRSFVDLSGQKTVRFHDSQTVDNPRSILGGFSESSPPPLQFEANIRLSVPRFHMEPRLSDIHASFFQLSSFMLSLLRDLVWWAGPGAGREFLVMWDASGAVEHMHSEILERFKGEFTSLSLSLYHFTNTHTHTHVIVSPYQPWNRWLTWQSPLSVSMTFSGGRTCTVPTRPSSSPNPP